MLGEQLGFRESIVWNSVVSVWVEFPPYSCAASHGLGLRDVLCCLSSLDAPQRGVFLASL